MTKGEGIPHNKKEGNRDRHGANAPRDDGRERDCHVPIASGLAMTNRKTLEILRFAQNDRREGSPQGANTRRGKKSLPS